jgi:multidrug efflux pump subunit AcrA (membrane-fusion protein)
MLAQVSIVTATRSDAILVPRDAILGTPTTGMPAAVVAITDGHAQHANVRVGLINEQVVEIQSGLADGQVVVVGKATGVNDGDVVVPRLRTALVAAGAN